MTKMEVTNTHHHAWERHEVACTVVDELPKEEKPTEVFYIKTHRRCTKCGKVIPYPSGSLFN